MGASLQLHQSDTHGRFFVAKCGVSSFTDHGSIKAAVGEYDGYIHEVTSGPHIFTKKTELEVHQHSVWTVK
jgi:hypothetical protein